MAKVKQRRRRTDNFKGPSAVTIEPGIRPVTLDTKSKQDKFLADAGPYYRQAKSKGEKEEFLHEISQLWFRIWPEDPLNTADIDFARHRQKNIMKKIRTRLLLLGAFGIVEGDTLWRDFIAAKMHELHPDKLPSV
ncbi:hypothetical protein JR316_0004537 [Psilocybe cubensis]|uniref:Uncharacterized protein n=6 Tax=Psilocybe cubensis TaxID=181762 RepID=A0A8H8CKQ3_PSICU|nr:hypothetical protein JR316_0011699 [Psilocybe cubensis]XP_047744963.1 hypothetical protein JR316_0009543 [Psilocybe cubensis]XP_047746533.1 hypothetical protein JR316_0009370 [Psilocybe cubensis]XP_047747592.1 hypothetical protein JR316_0008564 [Psilocybe cubensis]XP_047750062.1 hypothetical protein JR316_0004537 [Psilocybe cubensis]KAH9476128.1 hypothetical protein JR316_0011699 [Psilocybe cubensis]KAH9477338.1 hypothetical protein JR316_0009543 [Psilocybe cubensis]KAH9478908.1 hypotheti